MLNNATYETGHQTGEDAGRNERGCAACLGCVEVVLLIHKVATILNAIVSNFSKGSGEMACD